DQVDLNRAP
ncbi:hypothetical protein VN97_g9789, partial [Penicillium thymicola]